ncbi:MAG TPA: sulfatase-like hydrolase/transferase [Chitinophagales bacterium]|nr:sulfatase-like hydrolase/transferase [Chitinophagales bacterium]
MKILTFLLLLIATIPVSTTVFSQRPNFVIIMLDDANESSVPPLGPSFLNYPSIERIYQEGLQICDAHCLQPLCNPSRYSMFTGMYPHVHGAIDNVTLPRPDLPTFYSIAAGHGYHNAYVGKYSNKQNKNIPGIGKTLTISVVDQKDPSMYYNGVKKSFIGSTTVIIDDSTEAWLATIDTPFIFGVGHIGTHTPIGVVNSYKDDYNGKGAIPDNFFRYTHDYPSFLYADSAKIADSNEVKDDLEKTYEILSEIDRGVGNIFSVLESRGILDNTMIIFTNDNGFFFGEHQLWSKGDAREPSSAIPLFIRYPAWFAAGTTVCNNLIALHDICPTILNAAGINTQSYNFQGQSINYLLQPGHERTSIYLEDIRTDTARTVLKPSWRAVRTLGFKYIRHRCESNVEELFDVVADPEENSNVVNDPAYADTLNILRTLLDSLAIATIDTFSRDTLYLPCTLIGCQQSTFYADADADGFGNANVTTFVCTAPPNYVSDGSDCNDANATIYPDAVEQCNGIDDNCNGSVDENAIIASISPPGNVALCKGTNITLTANSGSGISYQWMKNDMDISGATNQTCSTSGAADYKVRESSSFGCSSTSAATTISKLALPAATITPLSSLDICNTGSVVLQANGGINFTHQWIKGSNTIAGATNQNYTATAKGTYKVTVTNQKGCSKTSDGTKVTKSCRENSIISSSSNGQLSLYPNPFGERFVVELMVEDISATTATIEIFSEIGQRIYKEIVPISEGTLHQEVQLQSEAIAGIYLVKVAVNDRVYTGQITYQK